MPYSKQQIKDIALRLLAIREHTKFELLQKILGKCKGCDQKDIAVVIDELAAKDLQSDERFAVSYARMRLDRGYGWFYIEKQLKSRQVCDSIRICVRKDFSNVNWIDLAYNAAKKHCGNDILDYTNYANKIKRFLSARGFSYNEITAAIKKLNEGE